MSTYRALTGLNYPDTETGEDVRVEKGGKISTMGTDAAENELKAGNIEPWTEEEKNDNAEGGES